MSIHEEVQYIFRELFQDESLCISMATQAKDVVGWDSLMHIRLIMAIEKHFKIKFSLNDIKAFSCVGDLFDIVREKTA
jgi:acyl carrier protein